MKDIRTQLQRLADRIDGLALRERGMLFVAAVVLLFGVYPAPLTEIMHASVDSLLAHVSVSKLPPAETGVALLQTVIPEAQLQ